MFRTALAAAIIAAAPAAVFAETLMVGFYTVPQTDDEVITLLAEPGESGYVEAGVDIAGGVSVRKIVMDRDTGRSKGFGRMGMVGHEVPEPETCSFDLSPRTDPVGLALKAQEDAVAEYRNGLIIAVAMEKDLRALEAEELAAQARWKGAEVAVKKAADLHTAAHETAHTVQQRAQAARATADKKKGQPFEIAALTLELEYQKLLAADVAAEAELAAAELAAKQARDQYDNIRKETLIKAENLKRLRANNTLARARAEELRIKAGELVNAEILALAEGIVAEARAQADEFAYSADAAYATASFASKLGNVAKGVAKATAIGDAYADASAQASAVAELGLTTVEQQRKAGPIPPLDSEEEVEQLPQMKALTEVLMAAGLSGGLALANAMGLKGENPLYEGKAELRAIIEATCGPDDDCDGEADVLLAALSELQYLSLQSAMQNENRQYTTVSNVLKTKHDTAKNSVSNIR